MMAAVSKSEKELYEEWKNTLKNDNRDISDLWQEALKNYKGIVGFDLQRSFDNVQDMIKFANQEMERFHDYRHNKGKVDRLRSAFASSLGYVETAAQILVPAVEGAFPPAAAIGTALTLIIKGCRSVTVDYDILVVFFEDMNGFLNRIAILETRLPKHRAYQNCLMEVFVSMLTICGQGRKCIDLRRFKKWISNLVNGDGGELTEARDELKKKLDNLQMATQFAILANTEARNDLIKQLDDNQRSHAKLLESFRSTIDSIYDETRLNGALLAQVLEKLSEQPEEEKQLEISQTKNHAPSRGLLNGLMAIGNNDSQYQGLKHTHILGSCSWLPLEAQWEQWHEIDDGKRPLLVVTGYPGVGKSHLAAAIYEKLQEKAKQDTTGNTCVIQFYFNKDHHSLSCFLCGLITLINQIAETNDAAYQILDAQIKKDELGCLDRKDWRHLVEHLLKPVFERSLMLHVFVVLDAINETTQWSDLMSFLYECIGNEKLRVSVVATCRLTDMIRLPDGITRLKIEVTKEKQRQDFKLFIWDKIQSLKHLKTFSRYVQQRVADVVEETSSRHLLTCLDDLGREGAVLKALKQKMPHGLFGMYETLVAESLRLLPKNHQKGVVALLQWIAVAQGTFTLEEIQSLAKHLSHDSALDLDKVPGLFSKFITVGNPGFDIESQAVAKTSQAQTIKDLTQRDDENDGDSIYYGGSLPVRLRERFMQGYYFETFGPNEPLIVEYRSEFSAYQRFMFLTCTELAQSDRTDVEEGLKRYCALNAIWHWSGISTDRHTHEENAEVLEAFAKLLSNRTGLSSILRRADVTHPEGNFENINDAILHWNRTIENVDVRDRLSLFATEWWHEVGQNPPKFRLGLAKAYLLDVYQSDSLQDAINSWKRLLSILERIGMSNDLICQGRENFPEEFENFKDQKSSHDSKAVLGCLNLFDTESKPDASSHRAVAELLRASGHLEPAEKTCKTALNLSNLGIPAKLKRVVYTTYGFTRAFQKKFDTALEFLEKAKDSDPDGFTPSDLDDYLHVSKTKGAVACIRVLKGCNLTERMSWLVLRYQEERSKTLDFCARLAKQANEQEFIVSLYEEAVKLLDRLDAATPLRTDLAVVYAGVCNNSEGALQILEKVFDSRVIGRRFPITHVDARITLLTAVELMANVQVALFQKSRDPDYKTERLRSLAGLMQRPFPMQFPNLSTSFTMSYRLALSCMYMSIGPLKKFHETLQSITDDAFVGLGDSVDWNDIFCLFYLAQVLALLSRALKNDEGLIRYARILGSAIFSQRNSAHKGETHSEGLDSNGQEEKTSAASVESSSKNLADSKSDMDDQQPVQIVAGLRTHENDGENNTTEYESLDEGDILDSIKIPFGPFRIVEYRYLKLPIEGWRGVKNVACPYLEYMLKTEYGVRPGNRATNDARANLPMQMQHLLYRADIVNLTRTLEAALTH
ncbi:hypothetical protein CTAM01_04858 [Colletotrichum tamarilloi]|uniref:Fungal STAND N-terminal Goodbye domain-containing protein n=1 Tax=Colletotrichum tamarilloi TaxID=1209934 RepID=A0ABQ9RFL3_9PEZI|nr:uncharacterized protein CTAM01_04858 [Colletotrichum tamarilloi]KAK1502869.1 hypothetical protein CTAM01_04858 [Colletotrichum tamarilloi]